MTPDRLAGLNTRLRGMRLGNFEFVSEGLWLGAAKGNRFQVLAPAGFDVPETGLHPVCKAGMLRRAPTTLPI